MIIGAGLAGLAAAYSLKKAGWDIVILEARHRIGGRVRTYRFDENPALYCELGGEWVGRQHDRVRALCREFGLRLIPHRFDASFAKHGKVVETLAAGKLPFKEALLTKLTANAKSILLHEKGGQQKEFDKQDWWTCLRDLGFSREDLLLRDLMDSTDFGESIRHVGAFSAISEYYGEGSNKYDEMDLRIEGGNSHLVCALAERVGHEAIHTSMEATEVIQKDGGVIVWAKGKRAETVGSVSAKRKKPKAGKNGDHQRFMAAYCICTVPARVLLNIQFDPALPRVQKEASKELQYARIMKTVLLFETRFWKNGRGTKFSCFTDATSDFIFDATLGQSGGQGILCSYAIGDKADDLAACATGELKDAIEGDLARLFPGSRTKPIAIERCPWQEDRYTQGAYALYRPGQWFTLRKSLSTPHRNVYFAGEHMAEEQGFMDGAIDSGEDAAKEVNRAYNRENCAQ